MPYTTKGRHNDLYGVEYTHPDYNYENVTFVSPYSSSNYPLITVDQWFGMKFVIYNVNNNQTVHAEMWVDPNPINTAQNGYNNNWKKVWVYEHLVLKHQHGQGLEASSVQIWPQGGCNCLQYPRDNSTNNHIVYIFRN